MIHQYTSCHMKLWDPRPSSHLQQLLRMPFHLLRLESTGQIAKNSLELSTLQDGRPLFWHKRSPSQRLGMAGDDPDGFGIFGRGIWRCQQWHYVTLRWRFVCSEQAVKTEWTEETNAQACPSCALWCSVHLQYFSWLVQFPCLKYLGRWPHQNPLQGIGPVSSTDLSAVYYCWQVQTNMIWCLSGSECSAQEQLSCLAHLCPTALEHCWLDFTTYLVVK